MLDSNTFSCHFWSVKGGFVFTAVLVGYEQYFFSRKGEILIDSISFGDLKNNLKLCNKIL